ncbi:hypothetical protein GQ457_18G010610 [Hibiscus cannabinus]
MNILPKLDITNFNKCEICVEAKHAKPHLKTVSNRKTELLELVHTDLADFRNTESKGGKHYYITFVDDFSRYTKVYLLRTKDEAENFFLIYKAEVENQLDRRIKRLRSDRGGEYGSHFLKYVCEKNGIIHETSAPYFPQQNGIAERKNRTLKEMMNSLLISYGLSDNMWGDAILSANHILNRVPHKKLDNTPYELWKGYAPNLQYLKVWGCLAKVGLPDFKKSTIGSKTVDAVFIGYASSSAAYRFMILNDYSICESRDAVFFENTFPLKKPRLVIETQIENLPSTSSSVPARSTQEIDFEPRRSKRQRVETSFGPDFITSFISDINDYETLSNPIAQSFLLDEGPKTYEEAIRSIDSSFWISAINDELESIKSNHTWELVDLPRGFRTISNKWVFRKKLRPDGSIQKYKAKLVVKGFTQKFGIDFYDTYSPVTKISTIRALFTLASIHKMHVHQMDVKTAFLNGELDEEIYMEQPLGFEAPGMEGKVYRLKKSLYGLKQAPK